MIKILVIDDSIFMRKIIADMLQEEKDIQIVGVGKNGKEAVEMSQKLKPDIITLDIEMPLMNGLEALKIIMKESPTKVIMVSSLTFEGAKETIEALNNGAFDFLPKPSGQISLDIRKVKDELVEKIRAAYETNIKLLQSKEEKDEKFRLSKFIRKQEEAQKIKVTGSTVLKDRVVAIGISTGGPKALQNIIPMISEDINAGILIVQHMPPKFTKSLAERLDLLSDIRVKEAEDGDKIKKGLALIAPGDYHMEVKVENGEKVVRLNQNDPYSGHRPSVNVLFKSVAEIYKDGAIGVIMTGMGGDGAEYLKKIKENGGRTIAQNKDSCVVFGMPKVAIEMGAVDDVVDLDGIPNKIAELLRK